MNETTTFRLRHVGVMFIALTIAPLIVVPEIVWSEYTVNVSALELLAYPTMVFSGFVCASEFAVGCAWFATTQQLYNALAIQLNTGRWIFVLAWVSYVVNTCITSYMAVCAFRRQWMTRAATTLVSSAPAHPIDRRETPADATSLVMGAALQGVPVEAARPDDEV